MVEGFWFGFGLIGIIGAVVPVVFMRGSKRTAKRANEKDYANLDDHWANFGDSNDALGKDFEAYERSRRWQW